MGRAGVARVAERPDHDLAAAQALADVVVRLAFEREVHAADEERAETLARAAAEPQAHAPLRQSCATVPLGDAPRDACAHGEVVVPDVVHPRERPPALQPRSQHPQDLLVERLHARPVIALDRAAP